MGDRGLLKSDITGIDLSGATQNIGEGQGRWSVGAGGDGAAAGGGGGVRMGGGGWGGGGAVMHGGASGRGRKGGGTFMGSLSRELVILVCSWVSLETQVCVCVCVYVCVCVCVVDGFRLICCLWWRAICMNWAHISLAHRDGGAVGLNMRK